MLIVGQGLAGTLAALELEKRGQSFRIIDEGSGVTSSRAAAGLFNPLTGPRFSPSDHAWNEIVPFYRDIEAKLGEKLLHLVDIIRPLEGAKVGPEAFPRSAPGWIAELCPHEPSVRIRGGGWIDIELLLTTARRRWKQAGVLEERSFDAREGLGESVLWCGGIRDFLSASWSSVPGVEGLWQAVRGDVLTVKVPKLQIMHGEIGSRFLIPLGKDLYRWGATHESDVLDMSFRPAARQILESELRSRLQGREFEIVQHLWGIRPASRTKFPFVLRHPDQKGWMLFNGFGGRGVALIPQYLAELPY